MNVIKEDFFPLLLEKQQLKFAIKPDNGYMCIKTPSLKFLDITQFLAPGCSYDTFLKAYGIEEEKGFFPYDWLDCLEKLNHPCLPPHSAFYNELKECNISEEEYAYCQQV